MKMPDRWLSVVLLAVALKQGIFLTLIPVWQVPDEPAHVAYVQSLVEQHQLPVFSDQGMDVSSEMRQSLTAIENTNPQRLGRHYPPGFLQSAGADERKLVPEGQPVRNLAARNSPLYYLYEAAPYSLGYSASIETRLLFMRVASALLLLVTVWLAVKIGRLLSTDRWFGLAVGLVVGFHPAASLLFAGVNPDAALTVLACLALWLMVKPRAQTRLWPRALALAVVTGLAISVKAPGWFLLGPALVWWVAQYSQLSRLMWLKLGLVSFVVVVLIGASWLGWQGLRSASEVVGTAATSRPPLSWQRVLTNDLFERPVIVWRTFWGHVGWSGVSRYNEPWTYVVVFSAAMMALVGIIRAAWQQPRRYPLWVWLMVVAGITLEIFYQFLYWQAGLVSGYSHFPIHGRYYLPLLVPVAFFLVSGITKLFPARRQAVGHIAVVLLMVALTTTMAVETWTLYAAERAAGW